jgi:DNA (cytosine-5)-methyltransferase 1
LSKAGFKTVAGFDLDNAALETFRANFGDVGQKVDLLSETPKSYKPDLVVAGPPCQGFSTIGKRRVDDPRNELLSVAAELAVAQHPKAIIIENVAGSISGAHQKYWDRAKSTLKRAGFYVSQFSMTGEHVGLAQRRKRIFLLAQKQKENFEPQIEMAGFSNVREALRGIDKCADFEAKNPSLDSLAYRIASQIPPGKKLCNVRGGSASVPTWAIPSVYGETSAKERDVLVQIMKHRRRIRRRSVGDADPVRLSELENETDTGMMAVIEALCQKGYLVKDGQYVDLKDRFNGKYRRLSWEGLSPTVDTRFGDITMFVHPEETRPMTYREAARLQGFRDNYIFLGSEKDKFRQIGNAVAPPVAECLGRMVLEDILGGDSN